MKLTPLIFSLKSSDDRCLRSTVRSYSTYRLVAVWTRRARSDVALVRALARRMSAMRWGGSAAALDIQV